MYKYILFDFDGTVFDTVEGITKSVQYALAKRGIAAELDSLRCFAGPPLVDMFMEKFDLSQEEAEAATDDFRERYQPIGLHECRVFPGIKELLRSLIEAGLHVGIATSKPQHLAEELEAVLRHILDSIVALPGLAVEVIVHQVSEQTHKNPPCNPNLPEVLILKEYNLIIT